MCCDGSYSINVHENLFANLVINWVIEMCHVIIFVILSVVFLLMLNNRFVHILSVCFIKRFGLHCQCFIINEYLDSKKNI